ncbi:MAG: isocitrate/isopropylmalate family dehydrogenase, partial [Alphaproteobacteria bacterium]
MKLDLVYLPGDGVGPEVGAAAMRVLEAVCERFGHELAVIEHPIGGAAIDALGVPLSDEAVADCRASGAVLLAAVGGPRWDSKDPRPEAGLFRLRRELGVFANLRPVVPHRVTRSQSPLKEELLEGVDILFVRELTGGIYFGEKHRTADRASDLCVYSRDEIARIVRMAASLAAARRGKLTSVDKANVLETSRLWREVTVEIVEAEFPQLELEHLLVDAAAMHLLSRPRDFDVIVTENMFGDIL